MASKLYVGGLPYSTTDQELEELFATYGTVVSAKVITDKETNRSRGFGFVEIESSEDAQKAIQALHESDFGGRKIIVNEARPREDKPNFGGNRTSGSN